MPALVSPEAHLAADDVTTAIVLVVSVVVVVVSVVVVVVVTRLMTSVPAPEADAPATIPDEVASSVTIEIGRYGVLLVAAAAAGSLDQLDCHHHHFSIECGGRNRWEGWCGTWLSKCVSSRHCGRRQALARRFYASTSYRPTKLLM